MVCELHVAESIVNYVQPSQHQRQYKPPEWVTVQVRLHTLLMRKLYTALLGYFSVFKHFRQIQRKETSKMQKYNTFSFTLDYSNQHLSYPSRLFYCTFQRTIQACTKKISCSNKEKKPNSFNSTYTISKKIINLSSCKLGELKHKQPPASVSVSNFSLSHTNNCEPLQLELRLQADPSELEHQTKCAEG